MNQVLELNRCNTLRCYPAKVPELIQNCCDYLEKNGKERKKVRQFFS